MGATHLSTLFSEHKKTLERLFCLIERIADISDPTQNPKKYQKNFRIAIVCEDLTRYYAISNKYTNLDTNFETNRHHQVSNYHIKQQPAIVPVFFCTQKRIADPSSGIQPDRQKERYRDHEHSMSHSTHSRHHSFHFYLTNHIPYLFPFHYMGTIKNVTGIKVNTSEYPPGSQKGVRKCQKQSSQ